MRKKNLKVRVAVVLQMLLTRKGGPMRDWKKHRNRKACRGRVVVEE